MQQSAVSLCSARTGRQAPGWLQVQLAEKLQPRREAAPGKLLCRRGDTAQKMWILTEGQVPPGQAPARWGHGQRSMQQHPLCTALIAWPLLGTGGALGCLCYGRDQVGSRYTQ